MKNEKKKVVVESDGVYVKLNGELTKVCPVPSTGFGQTDIKWINYEPTTMTMATTYKVKEMK
ncbi:hypothetical protein [Brochothrix campestris]|uniref:DUF3954 domain-containing protein n=1 Tax=Brochothrix campestris FSL F6-1037 TaxID=1265861 RepID=W7D1Y7_9LIST|nr:hypothetical protein [Brochothrix campestris]EUJ41956.1 hypothetical protein BCAMP_01055 [Brochothrix campestris FSL F6-1037]